MRYTCLTDLERRQMLNFLGIDHINQAYDQVSRLLKQEEEYSLPRGVSEPTLTHHISSLAKKNFSTSEFSSFMGGGAYSHNIPSAVDYLVQRGEFLTSYTPYQPEVSQGTLQVIFEFQTIISRLTGLEISNASMYDGQTSLAEAVIMSLRVTKNDKVHILSGLNPDYQEVLETYYRNISTKTISVARDTASLEAEISDDSACAIVQIPDYEGNIAPPKEMMQLYEKCEQTNTLLIVTTSEILYLGLHNPPPAHIVCGSAASLGMPIGMGGPGLGFLSSKKSLVRQIPGRICGVTVDQNNKRGFVLTLNAREQHIRRERATSNICSNQGLCATAFTIHATLLGEIGMKRLAKLNHHKTCELSNQIQSSGGKLINKSFFNEFRYTVPNHTSEDVLSKLQRHKILGGVPFDRNSVLVSVTETNSYSEIEKYATALKSPK